MATFKTTFELSSGFSSEIEFRNWFADILEKIAHTEYKKITSIEKIDSTITKKKEIGTGNPILDKVLRNGFPRTVTAVTK
jgi:hypothetical protein